MNGFRFNFNQKFQIESGVTLQESLFDELVVYSDNLKGKREFLRSPKEYGYIALDYLLSSRFRFSTNLVHTGKMDLLHMAGSPEQPTDQYITSKVFNAIGLKATYVQKLEIVGLELEYGFGVKNLTNDYQDDFDTFKNRDSNFVYGPSIPRTIYFSLILKSL